MQPTITTSQLNLRPFSIDDTNRIHELLGDGRIAEMTATIPFPYPIGAAHDWIDTHHEAWKKKIRVTFAIILAESNLLIGCISLINIKNSHCELGYWLGVEYWGNNYCTEACKAVIEFGTIALDIKTVYAKHLVRNPASGKVLKKCGLIFVHSGSEEIPRSKTIEEYHLYEIRNINSLKMRI